MRILCWAVAVQLGGGPAAAADFNIDQIGQSDPHPGSPFYADVWAEGDYAYVGSDRTGKGVSVFDISVSTNPQFIRNPANLSGPITLTTYAGSEMEDVEVHNGIGYFGSDVNNSTPATGTGVDIVDLADPANPVFLSRIDATIGGHYKVHTLSVSDGFLYTADNITDTIRISDVTNPLAPEFLWNVNLDAPTSVASHEVVVRNNRMFVASKRNDTTGLSCCGWTHIYDVSNVDTTEPELIAAFPTGARAHTSMPNEDGTLLVVTEERPDGGVLIYDISNIDQANFPDEPEPISTLTRSSVGIDAHSPHHPHMHGDMLFVTWYEAGLQAFNIADPENPIRVGSFDTYDGTVNNFNGSWGVFLGFGMDKVLLSDRQKGLIIVDATEAAPTGDFNLDDVVDGADFLAWQRGLGASSGATRAQGDGNRDRTVNGLDLDVWQAQFGGDGSHPAVGAVPECSTIWMVITCALALRGFRSRREGLIVTRQEVAGGESSRRVRP